MQSLTSDVIKETLYELSVKEIMSICSTNKSIQSICNDEQFWHQYVIYKHEFNNPWKQLAKLAEKEKEITIYKNGRISKMIIYSDMTLPELFHQVNLLHPNNELYVLQLIHPFRSIERAIVSYKNNKITFFHEEFRRWVYFFDENEPLSKNLLYDMLWQIDVSD